MKETNWQKECCNSVKLRALGVGASLFLRVRSIHLLTVSVHLDAVKEIPILTVVLDEKTVIIKTISKLRILLC